MKIGILSDTHGQQERTASAIQLLRHSGAQYYLHCGDIGGHLILDLLAGLPAAYVWGNCDYSRSELDRYAAALGIRCCGPMGRLELGGKQVVFLHGDNPRDIARLLMEDSCHYLCYGHTHALEDRRDGRMHIINPGALYRVTRKTVALLDTDTDKVIFLDVASPPERET